MAPTDSGATLPTAENLINSAVGDAFNEYLRRARTQVLGTSASSSPVPTRWPGQSLWVQLVEEFVFPVLEEVFGEAFAASARSDLLQVAGYREQYMATARDRLSEALWPEVSHERLNRTLAQGLDRGESIPELRERASEVLSVDANSYLAERIARTEAHTAVEGGSYSANLAWQDATGEQLYQRWMSATDNRVRPDHASANGQIVRLGTPFRVGGYSLAFPGDPTAPADQVIACRCTTITGTLSELEGVPVGNVQGAALPEETAIIPSEEPSLIEPRYWRGVLAPLGVRGDFRILVPPEGEVPTTAHMWLSYQERSDEGHNGKVAVGRIDRVWVQDEDLWGEGEFDLADETGQAWSVARKVQDRFAGTVSIDQNDLEDATITVGFYDRNDQPVTPPEDPDELDVALESGDIRQLVEISNWRLSGATLVQDPAFATSRDGRATAFIEIYDPAEASAALTAAAVGDLDLPFADRDREWDGPAALSNLQEADRLSDGTLWRDDDADPDSNVQADFRLPFADIIDGTLTAVPRGIFAVAGVLQGSMGGVDLPQEAQNLIRSRVQTLYERMAEFFDDDTIVVPWADDATSSSSAASHTSQEPDAVTASATLTWPERVAQAVPAAPPEAWFSNPQLTGLTKVRITDEGRVYGHIADWSQRHIGYMGEQVFAPRCPEGGTYPRFHRSPVRTAEGTRINTGPLTTAGHADTSGGVTMSAAMAHYDDPRFVLANVVAGEDEFGIWVAGALRPGVEAWQVAFGDTYGFSGDWRFGHLVAACSVSVGGFHVPNDDSVHALAASAGVSPAPARYRQVLAEGQVVALVSAGVLAPTKREQARSANARIFSEIASTRQELSGQLGSLADEVVERLVSILQPAVLDALKTHARQEAEFASAAREINAELAMEAERMADEMKELV